MADYEDMKEVLLLLSSSRFRNFIVFEKAEPSEMLRLGKLVQELKSAAKDINKGIRDLENKLN